MALVPETAQASPALHAGSNGGAEVSLDKHAMEQEG